VRRALAIAGMLALAIGAFGRTVCADDVPVEDRVALMVFTETRPRYVGEVIRVHLWIGYDATWFGEHAVRTFLRPMDVPMQVEVPWWLVLPGTVPVDRVPVDADGEHRSFALNDVVTRAYVGGRPRVRTFYDEAPLSDERPENKFTTLALERTFVATGAGDLVLPAPTLRFAYATEFLDDLVGGRRPVDRRDVEVRGGPLTIEVMPLPEAGRPSEFVDAVGTFSVAVAVDRHEVEVGRPFRLTLRVKGNGNLASIASPRLDAVAGFHVYGVTDDRGPATRTIVFDVAAIDPAVKQFPPIPFAFFSPEPPAGYRVVRTTPIPLTVRPAAGATTPIGSVPGSPERTPGLVQEPWFLWLSGTLVVLLIAALTLRAKGRAKAAAAIDPATARALAAGDVFRTRVSNPDGDAAEAFAEFLAARLGSAAAAVITPDLRARLGAAGAPDDLADHAAATLERLVAARYARAGTMARAAEGLGGLVEALERALRPPGELPHGRFGVREFPSGWSLLTENQLTPYGRLRTAASADEKTPAATDRRRVGDELGEAFANRRPRRGHGPTDAREAPQETVARTRPQARLVVPLDFGQVEQGLDERLEAGHAREPREELVLDDVVALETRGTDHGQEPPPHRAERGDRAPDDVQLALAARIRAAAEPREHLEHESAVADLVDEDSADHPTIRPRRQRRLVPQVGADRPPFPRRGELQAAHELSPGLNGVHGGTEGIRTTLPVRARQTVRCPTSSPVDADPSARRGPPGRSR